MSLPRYPEYKDSGMEWLGVVPGHWGSASLRWLSTRYSGGTPDKLNLDYWTDGTIPWLNSGEVNQSLISEPSTYITEEAFQNSSAKWIPQGALVMALAGQGKTKGMVAQLGIPTTCNQSMAAIIPTQEQDARFLFWWLTSNYQNIRNMAGGDLRDGLNLELLGNIPCPLAPITEQQTIAAFLDRETGKIDALIAEQQRLVELLAEKRQAVISHAVTKGLNPTARMKDSGIEWLGEVPEHWEVKKVKFLLARDGYKAGPFGSSLITSELSEEGNILVLTPEHIANERLDLPFNQYLDESRCEEMAAFFVDKNDIVFPIVGTLGRAMIISGSRPGILNQRLARMTADIAKLQPAYLKLILTDVDFYKKLDEIESKGAILNHITKEKLINRPVLLPPLKEQEEILSFLDSETAKFDTLTAEANRAIALLQERRSALISAAVTGKIDVRSLSPTPLPQAGEGQVLEVA